MDGIILSNARARLEAADAAAQAHGAWRSLAPGRETASTLGQIVRRLTESLAPAVASESATVALAFGCADVLEVTLDSFPDNVFWDLDALIATIWRGGLATDDPAADIAARCQHIAMLMRLFGRQTPIRFRYVHDFTYGFDWTRWIRKPARDRIGGPFDWPFLRYLERRGNELLELIANDDDKYPKLANGDMRNPFAFSREPVDEIRLHEDLAARGQIPLAAWDVDATPRCDRSYANCRAARALELSIPSEGP